MAVKIKEDGRVIFRPYGVVSKVDREKAENLDLVLKEKLPDIAKETKRLGEYKGVIAKWHYFGKEIAKIIDNPELMPRTDVESGDIWLAIRQNLPVDFELKDTGQERNSSAPKNRNRDHLSIAYKLGQREWDKVKWLKRWYDWKGIHNRSALLANEKIFESFREVICNLKSYPSDKFFKALTEALAKQFPEGTNVDFLNKEKIKKIIRGAIQEVRASGIKK